MPTYLSKITTPPALAQDIHWTHQILTNAICPPGTNGPGRAAARLLHRVERGGRELLTQSTTKPDPTRLPIGCKLVGVKPLDPLLNRLANGTTVRYKITANPTHAPNRTRQPITDPARIQEWWERTATRHGLTLETVELVDSKRVSGRRRQRWVVVQTATLTGKATIADVDAVRAAVENGVGHARAYGCGLLSVIPLG